MKQRTLLSKPKKVLETTPELTGYHKIVHDGEHENIFNKVWQRMGEDLLFDHSVISPFAYFNAGQLELFVNDDWATTGDIIPVVKKFKNTPRYMLYCPVGNMDRIYETMKYLDSISAKPAQIIAVNTEFAELYRQDGRFKVSKSGKDYVDNIVVQSQLKGGEYKRLRNHISKAERTILGEMGGHYERLSPKNVHLAVALFKEWNETQGKKYLRGAVGRDIRLVEHYANRMTDDIVCELVIVDGKAVSCIFSCIFKHDPTQSVAVMAKSLTAYDNASYMNELHCKKLLVEKGVVHENVAGVYGAGTKMSKGKWKPEFTRDVFTVTLN